MASIRSKDTKPELALRAALRAAGIFGYRVNMRALPGNPDIAFTRWKVAVFVDGAFWHGHPDHWHAHRASEYWRAKISRTQERDRIANHALSELKWAVLRFWDFEIKDDTDGCVDEIRAALQERGHS